MTDFNKLRQQILDSDNTFCFIEREQLLRDNAQQAASLPPHERYAFQFELLCDHLSPVCHDGNPLCGRFVEGPWPYQDGFCRLPGGLWSNGHITHNWPRILQHGLQSFIDETEAAAQRRPNANTRFFADSIRRCLQAVDRFAHRYADAAQAEGKLAAARALQIVPFRPAYDFFSAVQSVWFWQFITSGICGARDFALSRLDEYLLPFYEQDIASGAITAASATELLACLCLKTNELAGTTTDDFRPKPIPCPASKQYVTLRGDRITPLTAILIDAEQLCGLPQPTLNFRLSLNDSDEAWQLAAQAALLPALPNFFNSDLIKATLIRGGIPADDADSFDFTACNRVNIPGKLSNLMNRIDHFTPTVEWFLRALHETKAPNGCDDILAALSRITQDELTKYADANSRIFTDGPAASLDSLAVDSCVAEARDIQQGGADATHWQHHLFTGLATMANSLAAIQYAVFEQHLLSYQELIDAVDSDFANHDKLLADILAHAPKFGNDDDAADSWAVKLTSCLLDAMDAVGHLKHIQMFPSLYSLSMHQWHGNKLQATPDGRRAHTHYSENMSPVYGTDHQGPTALLRSLAKLPQSRLVCGGLNLRFAHSLDKSQIIGLLKSYWSMGGIHLGFTMISRQTLEDARQNPQHYRTLMVRKFGFSEYYVSLSPAYQQEIIDRTEW